jgi:hypothetical protein
MFSQIIEVNQISLLRSIIYTRNYGRMRSESSFAASKGLRDTLIVPHVFGKVRCSWR